MREQEQQRARELAQAAHAAESRGDLAHAIAALEQAVALAPSRARWHYRLGVLHGRREEWAGAAAALETATGLDATRPGWMYRLGHAREQAWQLAGACEAYAEAVALAPTRQSWARRLERTRAALATFRPFTGLVIAHRGAIGGSSENAVGSVERLPPQVAGVEVDVRFTRDGVAVLMHDRAVDRTTGGHGAVHELSYAELSAHRGRDGSVPPTLEEYLQACSARNLQLVLIDVKVPTRPALAAVASSVRSSAIADACVVMVRDEEQLPQLRELVGGLRTGCFRVRMSNLERKLAAARVGGAELLLVDHGDRRYLRNRRAIAEIQRAGLRAGASTINSRSALEAARVDGCDLLITDVAHQLSYFAA